MTTIYKNYYLNVDSGKIDITNVDFSVKVMMDFTPYVDYELSDLVDSVLLTFSPNLKDIPKCIFRTVSKLPQFSHSITILSLSAIGILHTSKTELQSWHLKVYVGICWYPHKVNVVINFLHFNRIL